MASAPPARWGFFPLDEELALLPGRVTPRLVEELVHLATWMPFTQAAKQLKRTTRVDLSEPTVRRQTQAAGAAYVAVQTQAAVTILKQGPTAPCAPSSAVVSVDGAMVPLRRGEWAEVKTLVVGDVDRTQGGHLHSLSYFSRLSDAATFGDLAVVETQRRGVARAQQVAAVVDGAEWIQGFLDLQCPDAIRILDFPHAVEHLNQIGQAVLGAGTAEASSWLATQRHALKHTGPAAVLAAVHALAAAHPEVEAIREHVAYLEKRVGQMQYPSYQADGWPLGSGAVESANKVVVEARLKGAGMRWERAHVNPMVALRTVVYSDRWDEAWALVVVQLRQQAQQARAERRQQRRSGSAARLTPCSAALPLLTEAVVPLPVEPSPLPLVPALPTTAREPGRPAAEHPWRRAWSKRQQAKVVLVA